MNTETLKHRMEPLRAANRFPAQALDHFAGWVTEAPDEDLFRVNPLEYARKHGLSERDAIDLFVNATRAGIFDFAWGLICPACNGFLRAREGLKAVAKHRICAMCELRAGDALDDGVEVSFTVSPAVRRIRFHGGWTAVTGASADKRLLASDALRLYFSHAMGDATEVLDFFKGGVQSVDVVVRGEETVIRVDIDPGQRGEWRLLAPAVHAVARFVLDPAAPSTVTLDIDDEQVIPARPRIKPGPVEIRLRQRTDFPELLAGLFRLDFESMSPPGAGDEDEDEQADSPEAPPLKLNFLTGKRLLSTQSFRDLFRTETLAPDDSLEIRALAMLFTDLKASTQMYERVGDLKALALVRQHFNVLRDVIARHEGAIVKTIGDAVMATFDDPVQAAAAAVEMHRELQRVQPDELQLKVGVHVGPCVAVDSNERLDYFGQTVNIAARVQGLAEGREVVLTDSVLRFPGVQALLRQEKVAPSEEQAQLKGIDAPVTVHRATVQ